jgi:hypothetical protein
MQGGALEPEPGPVYTTTALRELDAFRTPQKEPRGGGGVDQFGRCALEDQLPTLLSRPRPKLDHVVGRLDGQVIVFHDHHRVSGVAESLQKIQQSRGVPRVEPNRGLVQHIEGVDEPTAQGVGQANPLGLASGKRTGLSRKSQVPESNVNDERQAGLELPENRFGDLGLHPAQFESAHPLRHAIQGKLGKVRDGPTRHRDPKGRGPDPGAPAVLTGHGALVLTKEDPDVLLVALPLLGAKERDDPLEFPGPVHDDLPETEGQLLPWRVAGHTLVLGEPGKDLALLLVSRLIPGVDGAFPKGSQWIGHDERRVVLEGRPEPRAPGAATQRVVEREELGTGVGELHVWVIGAPEPLGESNPGGCAVRPGAHQHHRLALALYEGGSQGIGQSLPGLVLHDQSVHDHHQIRHVGKIHAHPTRVLGTAFRDVNGLAVHEETDESQSPEVLDHGAVNHGLAEDQWKGHLDPSPILQGQNPVHRRRDRVGLHVPPALGAVGPPSPGKEEAQVVVDFRSGPHRGPAALGGVLLFDGHSRRDALDGLHVGLLHPIQELLGVGGE